MSQVLEIECPNCKGTGIYHGFAEPKGVGVICINCKGTGKSEIHYTPFTGRKTRTDIERVQYSKGALLVTGVGPRGNSISYRDFLAGKLPD
jgi:hypothetical protein